MPFFQGLFGPPNIQALAAKRDVDGLIKALAWGEDGERATGVRQAAAEALVEIGQPAVEPVIGALQDEKRCRQAAAVLGQIGGASAVGPLMAEFKSEHFSFRKECLVRAAAAEALVKIGQPAVAPLIAALGTVDDSANAAAVDALVKIGRPAVEPLVAALKHSRSDVREAAAAALGQIGDTRAVEPLVAALKHTDFRMNIYWSEKAISPVFSHQ